MLSAIKVRVMEPASAKDRALFANGPRPQANRGRELMAAAFAGPHVTDLTFADMLGRGRREQDVVALGATGKTEAAR